MASWRVVCVKKETVNRPIRHSHIMSIGTGDRVDWADMRWRLDEVLNAMGEGDTFYTQDDATGQVAPVEKHKCPHCHRTILRSVDGATPSNNLDDLRSCIYQ